MEKISLDLSLIIPAYNEEKIIAEVIKEINSILASQDLSYEILVVDDGSDDRTAEEAASAGARVISHPDNIGNGASIKTGIRNARGKLLLMMDADGQHPPEMIPVMLEEIGKYD
ncbi:MAG: glycosyltransferase family 2 protein, partial [Bacteroidetes bacterium]